MSSNYLTLTEWKTTAEMIGFSFADNDAELAISAASRGVDQYTGRRFYPDSSASTVRYYTPQNGNVLDIDDLIVCATVQTDWDGDSVFENTWTANTDYLLEPFNAAAEAKPYERLRVHPSSSLRFPGWPRSVAITGQWGWAAVPDPVKTATSILAARLLKRTREAPFGVVGLGPDMVAVRISVTDPDIAFLLRPYQKGDGVLAA